MANEITGVYLSDSGTTHLIDYGSLANRPAIPTKTSDLDNDSGFLASVPPASDSVAGVVKIDDDSIRLNERGQLYIDLRSTEGVTF